MKKADGVDDATSFEHVARELGCDPDDPRVAEVLKAMAAQPPKPHEPKDKAAPAGKTGAKPRQR